LRYRIVAYKDGLKHHIVDVGPNHFQEKLAELRRHGFTFTWEEYTRTVGDILKEKPTNG
jgi:hypothetical protein